MLMLWWMLVLSVRCSGADEIPIDRAEQSSTYNSNFIAANAIDNDLTTKSRTSEEDPASSESDPWLRVYLLSPSNVGQVVIERGRSHADSCTFTVSVYNGEVKTVCGTYTVKKGHYYNKTVQCGGKGGDSVRLEQTECTQYLNVHEIKVYGEYNISECSKPDITNAVLAPTSATIASGASYTVTCNEGTVMSGGSAQLLCTDEGSLPASLPSCEATGDLISLDRAEQSSTHEEYIADRAIDTKLTTRSYTDSTDPAWLRVYFLNPSYVEQVVIEQGRSHAASCTFTVSVYDAEVGTVCGTYTGKQGNYYNEMVQCGGKRGDSVRLKQTGCTKALVVLEIKVYGQLQENCDAGSYRNDSGCFQCPLGTWSPANASSCTNCTDGRLSPPGSTTGEDCIEFSTVVPLTHLLLTTISSCADPQPLVPYPKYS